MARKFYISDLHLGHKNCLTLDNRPFDTVEEMEHTIIHRWNSVVSKTDEVYILGDMFWNNEDIKEVLPQLKGNLYLIRGNHDRINADMTKRFVWIKDYAEIKDNGEHLILCHYPIAHWRNADYGTIHLYGHIHTGRDSRPFEEYVELMKNRNMPYSCYNVGCMLPYMDYTPRMLDEIIKAASAKMTTDTKCDTI